MWPPAPPDYWSISRANRERAEALAAFGFTERQARFLVQVLLHAGVFVERQYCQFGGITHGQKATDFLARLVGRQYATPIATGALHRGRLFHLHYKPERFMTSGAAHEWSSVASRHARRAGGHKTVWTEPLRGPSPMGIE